MSPGDSRVTWWVSSFFQCCGRERIVRAAPLVRVKSKFTVKFAVCCRRRLLHTANLTVMIRIHKETFRAHTHTHTDTHTEIHTQIRTSTLAHATRQARSARQKTTLSVLTATTVDGTSGSSASASPTCTSPKAPDPSRRPMRRRDRGNSHGW